MMIHPNGRLARLFVAAVLTGLPAGLAAEESVETAEATTSVDDEALPPVDEDAADDLDALLDLADNDFSQVARVNVAAPSLNMEVTTVSRKKSTVGRSAAAVYVISSDMIRRSGATTLPEVLRMAPGVQVARINSHQWAISIRGFNSLYSNKLQVQIDGRSVYTPLFGGVFWSVMNTPLADIERIEVIRGPGGTVWGANAVNGIINIITKHSRETTGLLVQAATGTMEHGNTTLRYGQDHGNGLTSRVYGTWADRNHGYSRSGLEPDAWTTGQTGFRVDYEADADDRFTLQGDYFDVDTGQANLTPNVMGPPFSTLLSGTTNYSGGNVLFRWNHDYSQTSDSALQIYYDRLDLSAPRPVANRTFANSMEVFDVDFQHGFRADARHDILWGLGYKHYSSTTQHWPGFLEFSPRSRFFDRFSGFVQDEITIRPEELLFTIGSKLSDNSYTGFEVQPTARLLWLPDDRTSVWAAVSRTVRIPTVNELDATITAPPVSTVPVAIFPQERPGSALRGHDVMAYELGIRRQPIEDFSWDFTTFINRYDNLGEGRDLGLFPVPGNPGALYFVRQTGIGGSAESYGAELTATVTPTNRTTLRGSYSYIQIFGTSATTAAAPRNQLYLQSSTQFSRQIEGDVIWRYVDHVPGIAPAYNVLDLRLAWKPWENLEWSFVARNLLDDKHPEYTHSPLGDVFTQVPTEVYTMMTLTY